MLRTFICLVTLAGWCACAADDVMGDDLFDEDVQIARLIVCYDYGCKTQKQVYLFESDWAPVQRVLLDSHGAADERERIALAVGIMEQVIGTMTPTSDDLPGNGYDEKLRQGQMDCIDESTNTSAYLSLFETQGLLKWHRVVERIYRAPIIIDEHWAAQIEERATGRRFAVDSWHRANGRPPVIQPAKAWRRGAPIPSLD